MRYISKSDLEEVFKIIYSFFDKEDDRVATYSEEQTGLEQLNSSLKRSELDYYPDVFDKATYLFINVNLGHFFSNGNKRLSLVISVYFLLLNNITLLDQTPKEEASKTLHKIFPEIKSFEDYPELTAIDFAFYNIAIIIADHAKYAISYEDLKKRVKKALAYFFSTP